MDRIPILHTIAPAKINWTLEVLGRREDGYHEIRSVMQTISLCDELEAWPAPRLSLAVVGEGAAELGGDDNLVLRAVRQAQGHGRAEPVAFRLSKRIPVAAGLGGGSSDAAAALRLLCSLWDFEPGRTPAMAAALGSDVPFFLRGGAQLAAGRGELLEPLPDGPPVHLVLLRPPFTIPAKTASLYALLDRDHYSAGEATERLADRLRQGHPPGETDIMNVFEQVADRVYPALREDRRALERATSTRALLAGAGPTLFALCPDRQSAERAAAALRRQGLHADAVHTIGAADATRVR